MRCETRSTRSLRCGRCADHTHEGTGILCSSMGRYCSVRGVRVRRAELQGRGGGKDAPSTTSISGRHLASALIHSTNAPVCCACAPKNRTRVTTCLRQRRRMPLTRAVSYQNYHMARGETRGASHTRNLSHGATGARARRARVATPSPNAARRGGACSSAAAASVPNASATARDTVVAALASGVGCQRRRNCLHVNSSVVCTCRANVAVQRESVWIQENFT